MSPTLTKLAEAYALALVQYHIAEEACRNAQNALNAAVQQQAITLQPERV